MTTYQFIVRSLVLICVLLALFLLQKLGVLQSAYDFGRHQVLGKQYQEIGYLVWKPIAKEPGSPMVCVGYVGNDGKFRRGWFVIKNDGSMILDVYPQKEGLLQPVFLTYVVSRDEKVLK